MKIGEDTVRLGIKTTTRVREEVVKRRGIGWPEEEQGWWRRTRRLG